MHRTSPLNSVSGIVLRPYKKYWSSKNILSHLSALRLNGLEKRQLEAQNVLREVVTSLPPLLLDAHIRFITQQEMTLNTGESDAPP